MMGSSESTKRLTVEKSRDKQNPGIIAVSERVVKRLRGEEELPLKSSDEISRDDINSLWQELQEKKAMLDHQKEHFQEFMQKAFDEGRKVESRRLKEGKIKSGNEADLQKTDNRWKKVLEQRESDSKIRENKLQEEINVLKEKIAENKAVTIEQFNKAVTDATKKYTPRPRKPPCQHLQNEVVNCYRKHPTEALRCSQQVHNFITCVEQAQVMNKGGPRLMELGFHKSENSHAEKGFACPLKASTRSFDMPPPSPPSLDDILSQESQRDFSSTQVFRSNCALFDGKQNCSVSSGFSSRPPVLVPHMARRPSVRKTLSDHQLQKRDGWLLSGFQLSQPSYLQSTPFSSYEDTTTYGDENLTFQDSPELFTPQYAPSETFKSRRTDFATRIGLERAVFSENDSSHLDDEQHEVSALEYNLDTPAQLFIPALGGDPGGSPRMIGLRSTNEVPSPFRSVFSKFPYFNIVQSKVFDEVMYTDRPLVVCAPTGSGKTVVFELAIIRLLMNGEATTFKVKVVYMAPMKAICSERFVDWSSKFEPFGLKCKEVTGDSELDDYFELQNVNVIMTTPEKWDSMTRKWRDNRSLVQSVKLFLIDEVHLLNDDERGATVEAVISRMKTVQSTMTRSTGDKAAAMRLLAISATIPNVEDIAAWLGGLDSPASYYSMDDSHRPVKLRKVVLGFPKGPNLSDFRFDLSLNYRLSAIIQTYSDRKPTLVFCSTRKGTQQAAQTLVKDARFIMNSQHRQRLQRIGNSLHDSKLRELVICGIGYHHAGLDPADRRNVEAMFIKGDLPVLFATSTLAVGVNLPAHLVIIKSTSCYIMGVTKEYSETQILQMIGRAGRPQFDTSATAVILTTSANKEKYSCLLEGTQNIESSLHHHLMEHLNAEIVLNTINDVSIALEWLKSTFLYIRILKNPTHYGIPEGLEKDSLEQKLQDICLRSLNTLRYASLIKMDDGFDLKPTEEGRLMARYCIAYNSMKQLLTIKSREDLSEMVELISKCKEFSDVKLRMNEKRALNSLNKDKNKQTIRFPINGKIKNTEQKVNCLIQATLDCLPVMEFSLSQDATKIFRAGQRITRCLVELQMLKNGHLSLHNAIILAKCMKARLWENSKFLSRQLEKIGPTLSTMMVNAGLTTFRKIEETNPREIEMIVNRHPPFGNQIREAASSLPKYEISVQQTGRHQPNRAEIVVTVTMTNHIKRRDAISTERTAHFSFLLIGDAGNKVVYKQRLGDAVFLREGSWSRRVEVQRTETQSPELTVNLISQEYVGLDVNIKFTPYYSGRQPSLAVKSEVPNNTAQKRSSLSTGSSTTATKSSMPKVPCNHRCLNREICGHECCKQGVVARTKKSKSEVKQNDNSSSPPLNTKPASKVSDRFGTEISEKNSIDSYLKNLHQRTQAIPGTPAVKRRLKISETKGMDFVDLTLDKKFGYKPKSLFTYKVKGCEVKEDATPSAKRCWQEIDWHQKRPATGRDFSDSESFDDELPCFSVDELWNKDEELGFLTLSDDEHFYLTSDQDFNTETPQMPSSSFGRSEYFEHQEINTLATKPRKDTNSFQYTKSKTERVRPEVCTSSKRNSSTGCLTDKQLLWPRQRPRRVSYPPLPPPTPGMEDFETSNTVSRETISTQTNDERNLVNSSYFDIVQKSGERDLSASHAAEARPHSYSNNLQGCLSLRHPSPSMTEVSNQSASSFFSSSSVKCDQEQERDAFAGIFYGLL